MEHAVSAVQRDARRLAPRRSHRPRLKWTADANYVDDDAHNIVSPVFSGVTIDADADGNYDTETASPAVTTDQRVRFVGTYAPLSFDAEDKSILLMGGNNTLYYPQSGAGIQHRLRRRRGHGHHLSVYGLQGLQGQRRLVLPRRPPPLRQALARRRIY